LNRSDTITAPATPYGEGGVGIVRVSGPDSESLLAKYFRPSSTTERFLSHYFYHGYFISEQQEPLDEVMAVLMRKPRSYTRENVVEIHCHGGYLSVQRILDTFISGGARLADPGEFTLRAFLNGRIDLTEAEAVVDIIRARSDRAARNALSHMRGELSSALSQVRSRLVDLLVLIEAYLDFPEEEVTTPHQLDLEKGVQAAEKVIAGLLDTFNFGRVLKEGLAVLLLGRPNVGKSSLLNLLLGENRAIVAELPGTTRDTIEENLTLSGFPLKLIDTAGVRESLDPVEAEGVKRTQEKLRSTDLVLFLIDGSQPLGHEDLKALELTTQNKTILVINKQDLGFVALPEVFNQIPAVHISAKTGAGLVELKNRIVEQFASTRNHGDVDESVILSSQRHRDSLLQSLKSLGQFKEGLEASLPMECLATDLRDAILFLGQVTGETLSEEVLKQIFSQFCIGK
jgi:tRNA modification GTPase